MELTNTQAAALMTILFAIQQRNVLRRWTASRTVILSTVRVSLSHIGQLIQVLCDVKISGKTFLTAEFTVWCDLFALLPVLHLS